MKIISFSVYRLHNILRHNTILKNNFERTILRKKIKEIIRKFILKNGLKSIIDCQHYQVTKGVIQRRVE